MSTKGKKTTQLSLKQQLIKFFTDFPVRSYNYKQICGKLGIMDKQKRIAVLSMLEVLAAEEVVIESSKGLFQANPEKQHMYAPASSFINGIVDMKQTGKAYIISPDTEEDVFISAGNTHHALDGDLVKVQLFPKRSGRKMEGEIIEIIERKRKRFVGIVSVGRKMSFLTPDDAKVPVDIIIMTEDLNGATSGMKAIAELSDWPEKANNPFGFIVQVLGNPGENEVEINSILAQNDFPLSFEKNTLKEAEAIAGNIPAEEIKKRRDFRNIFTITIDPEDAKDFDDGISLKKLSDGNFEVGIHIADVSYYVAPGTAIDKEAFERGTSVYLVDRVVPMLPERLSNELCSLRPGEDKLCFSAVFEMDMSGKVHKEWFGKTIIHSDIRFNYEQVQEVIEGGPHPKKEEIMTLHTIATSLRAVRFQKGSINFNSREIRFILDENNKPMKVVLKEQKESNHLVEEFMLLANRKVAEWVNHVFGKKMQEKPHFVYRIHDEPSPERLQNFAEFLVKLGYKLDLSGRKRLSNSLNSLLGNIHGKAEENMIETIAVRTMAKAVYSPDNIGHYGLGFSHYTHFTSPIRRYPDLIVHRLLGDYLNNNTKNANYSQLDDACKHCSNMEKKAADAERESVKFKQAEYMAEKIGETMSGVISGVSKWGLFVEVDEVKAEGLVRMNTLADDFYYLDEENYSIIGHRNGRTIRLGDRVSVLIKAVDLSKKQMDLGLVSHVSQNSEGKEDFLKEVRTEKKENRREGRNKKQKYSGRRKR